MRDAASRRCSARMQQLRLFAGRRRRSRSSRLRCSEATTGGRSLHHQSSSSKGDVYGGAYTTSARKTRHPRRTHTPPAAACMTGRRRVPVHPPFPLTALTTHRRSCTYATCALACGACHIARTHPHPHAHRPRRPHWSRLPPLRPARPLRTTAVATGAATVLTSRLHAGAPQRRAPRSSIGGVCPVVSPISWRQRSLSASSTHHAARAVRAVRAVRASTAGPSACAFESVRRGSRRP